MNGIDGLLLLFSQIDGLVRFDLGIIDDARYVISGAGFPSARAVSNERFSVVVGAVLQTNPARGTNQGRRLGLLICNLRRHRSNVCVQNSDRNIRQKLRPSADCYGLIG